ncbi:MAG TPA: RNA polymerase sigma-70 factor [Bacteroidales bacterium]|nr:RNA polymerase sigma-70 factor [Bacteroidales bacterium]
MILNTDENYILEISRGNKAAFDKLFKQNYILLRNYAFKLLQDKSLAEDIVQDIFFNIWAKRAELDKINNIKSYIRTSTHNACIDILRKRFQSGIKIEDSSVYEFEKLYADILQYQETYLNKELSLKIAEAIERLPPHCKTIFVLSRSFGFKNKEIAGKLEISVKAVEKQITKALTLLKEYLKEYLSILVLYFFL